MRYHARLLTPCETRWSPPPQFTMRAPPIVTALASTILAGEQTSDGIVARCARTLGRPWRWLGPLARRFIVAHANQTRPRRRDVIQFLLADEALQRALLRHGTRIEVQSWAPNPQVMQPVEAAAKWDLSAIESSGALADWLQLTVTELEWFADLAGRASDRRATQQLQHYRYQVQAKRSGGVRLLESPKPRLRTLQRRILELILNRIEPHAAAHGFRRGHSIKTFVAPHAGQRVILRIDLRDFFPSITRARIQGFFRTAGYPEPVADLLGGLCTNSAPTSAFANAPVGVDPRTMWEARHLYARPHLPQGAPTSPALANLCAYRADVRLAGLAHAAGAQYTRYADDVAFSGGPAFDTCVERFSSHAAAVLLEEGFAMNHRKTRVMRQGVRQHLAGLVVNEHPNLPRTDFDRLKAILHNCARLGPESQNREAHPHFRAHLEGRVSYMEMINPTKAQRLRAVLQRIEWP